MDNEYLVVLVTAPGEDKASEMAHSLLEDGLCACINITPKIRSVYKWQGNIVDEEESLLIIKTKKELFEDLKERIINIHPFDVPEVIALPIAEGSKRYLDWIEDSVK